MAKLLVRLEIENEASIRHSTDASETSREQIGRNGLRAHLIVSGASDPETEALGFVHLHIEASPRSMPAMTPEQTMEWLASALKKML